MKLKELYDLAIKVGISVDPRGSRDIERFLGRERERYEKLSEDEKEFYDIEKLKNPYSDTQILCGDPEMEISGILAGIDIEVGEVLLGDRLREKGEDINLLLAHHPEGKALAMLSEVMVMQADIWQKQGVPVNIGDVLIDKRMKEVRRTLLPVNHNRAIDVARILGFAYLTVHTPADNLVTNFVQKYLDEKESYRVEDVVKALREIPEYREAAMEGRGPTIMVGDPGRRAGKIVVDMTGGTEGPEEAIEKLADAGVGTLVQMHLGDKLRKKAEENHVNVVIAGHIPSDAIGLNLFLDHLEEKIPKIIPCSGLKRIKRY